MEPEAGVAGESGVASRSAGFATAVQDTVVAADAWGGAVAGMAAICRGMPAENTMIFGDFQ